MEPTGSSPPWSSIVASVRPGSGVVGLACLRHASWRKVGVLGKDEPGSRIVAFRSS